MLTSMVVSLRPFTNELSNADDSIDDIDSDGSLGDKKVDAREDKEAIIGCVPAA